MGSKFSKTWQKLLLLLLACLLLTPYSAEAGVKLKELKVGKTVKSYDLTGDGKKDKIKITMKDNYAEEGTYDYKMVLGGKTVLTASSARGCIFYYCKAGKLPLVIVQTHYPGGANDYAVYRYKNRKFRVVNQYMEDGAGFYLNGPLKKSGSKLVIDSSPKFFMEDASLFLNLEPDQLKVRTSFVYKKGNIKLSSRTAVVQGTLRFTAERDFTTCRKVSAPEAQDGVSVKKGERVKVDRVYFPKDTGTWPWYRVNKGGKTGWVEGNRENHHLLAYQP